MIDGRMKNLEKNLNQWNIAKMFLRDSFQFDYGLKEKKKLDNEKKT